MVSRTQASPWSETGVAPENPHAAATTVFDAQARCLSAATATSTPYFPVPYAHNDTFPFPNHPMSSRSFIFSNFYRVGSAITEHPGQGFSRNTHRADIQYRLRHIPPPTEIAALPRSYLRYHLQPTVAHISGYFDQGEVVIKIHTHYNDNVIVYSH